VGLSKRGANYRPGDASDRRVSNRFSADSSRVSAKKRQTASMENRTQLA
jgi:hypothetical protein